MCRTPFLQNAANQTSLSMAISWSNESINCYETRAPQFYTGGATYSEFNADMCPGSNDVADVEGKRVAVCRGINLPQPRFWQPKDLMTLA